MLGLVWAKIRHTKCCVIKNIKRVFVFFDWLDKITILMCVEKGALSDSTLQ